MALVLLWMLQLLELLNMKGKHKQKWDYLREILNEKIVYDDMLHRAWYADESLGQGLLFTCRQVGRCNLLCNDACWQHA